MSFASKDYTHGQTNAMIKKMIAQFGEDAPDMFLKDELILRKCPLFSSSEPFLVAAAFYHKTAECFQGSEDIEIFQHPELDTWTPQKRQAHEGGMYRLNVLNRSANFREIAAAILEINIETDNVDNAELQHQLIANGHCLEILQIDREIEYIEARERNTLLAKGNLATFFFVDNYDESVSVVSMRRDNRPPNIGKWNIFIDGFDDDHQWISGVRFFSRDSE